MLAHLCGALVHALEQSALTNKCNSYLTSHEEHFNTVCVPQNNNKKNPKKLGVFSNLFNFLAISAWYNKLSLSSSSIILFHDNGSYIVDDF